MSDSEKHIITGLIRDKARELGFELCGIAPASFLKENEEILREWLGLGMNAGMDYMARNIEKRVNPDALFEGAKSVIVTGLNYYTEKMQGGNGVPSISIYAYGQDYHDVILKKLEKISGFIFENNPGARSKGFVDSEPLLEKAWAMRAGLGWQGKHSIVINNRLGSFFFLGVVLTNLELEYDHPAEDSCGTCNECIKACPTGAINSNRTIDARKCIAYLTIDNKTSIAAGDIDKMEGRIVGCDRCQEVCPWNRSATRHNHPEFEISEELRLMTSADWLNLTREDHKRLFRNSAISRRKYEVFIQNVTNVTKSSPGGAQKSPLGD